MPRPKLVIIDAHGYLHRAFHALPPLTTSKGVPVGALYGFIRMILKVMRMQKPDYFAVCFDSRGKTFREEIYADYKATRKETDDALKAQFPLAREFVQAANIALFAEEGFEADDLIATLAKKGEADGMDVLIVTSDKDILQLVDDHIKVFNESKDIVFDAEAVKEKWGVLPGQIADMLALMGDASDNIPGVPGIGEKTAVKLIQENENLENLVLHFKGASEKLKNKILENREKMLLSRKLVSLNEAVPIDSDWTKCVVPPLDSEALDAFYEKLEFHALRKETKAKSSVQTTMLPSVDVNASYETILSEDALRAAVENIKKAGRVSVDLETTGLNVRTASIVGISLSWMPGEAVYIPVGHRYLGAPAQIPLESVLKNLRPVLEDSSIKKYGHNLKYDASMFEAAGIHIENIYFDSMVAAYCLDPSKPSYGLKNLVQEFLGRTMTRIEEILPKDQGDSEGMPTDQVEIERMQPYACADADCALQLAETFSPMLKEKEAEDLFFKVEMPLVPVLMRMEMSGIRVDTGYLESLGSKFQEEIRGIETKAYALAGQEFNLNSSKQLGSILFEKMNLPPVRKTKTGYSTDEETLKQLSASHELPGLLLRHRELAKLSSTYIDGLLSEVDPKTSRVHSSFHQTGTATGRFSSSDPNLQNIPIRSEQGRMIRRAFVPENGSFFISADYSQIDLRALAHLSGDAALIRAFKDGADIHRATAAEVFHLDLESVTEEQRKRAKAINFGIVYGQQAFGLAQGLGIPIPEAQALIDRYFERYSGIKQWMEDIKTAARKDGFVKTLLGHVRYVPDINAKNGAVRSFAERVAVNTPVQGTSSDIIKAAMVKIADKIRTNLITARMLVQVHDDLLFEVPMGAVQSAGKMIKYEMENAIRLSVPVIADLKAGKNWADMETLKIV